MALTKKAVVSTFSMAMMTGAAVVSFGAVYLRRYRGGQLSLDVQHDLRTALFDSVTRLVPKPVRIFLSALEVAIPIERQQQLGIRHRNRRAVLG